MTQVLETFPHQNNDFFIQYGQYHDCWWWPGNARSQDISSHGINLVSLEYSTFSTSRIKPVNMTNNND